MEGKGWWKSLQCLSMAEAVDLECSLDSLTMGPRRFSNIGQSYTHLPCIPNGRLKSFFWSLEILSFGLH